MRTNIYIKVEVEHRKEEKPEDLGNELCRQILKNYAVRRAEVSSTSSDQES